MSLKIKTVQSLRKITTTLFLWICIYTPGTNCQEAYKSFELRYFTKNPEANGITDFHGETEVFNTEERVDFLKAYGEVAKDFFKDPLLNMKVIGQEELANFLENLKPQPLPQVRTRLDTGTWKWIGYRTGQNEEESKLIGQWNEINGVEVMDSKLHFINEQVRFIKQIPGQEWRFFIRWEIEIPQSGKEFVLSLMNGDTSLAAFGADHNGYFYYVSGERKQIFQKYKPGLKYSVKMETDLVHQRYNVYINDTLQVDFVPLNGGVANKADHFLFEGNKGIMLDNIRAVGYKPTGNVQAPYEINTFLDEDFELKPAMTGWKNPEYNDRKWNETTLPKVHGGERFAGEDLYLRKTIAIGDYKRAILNIETIDPGGEIWINGEIAAVISDRHPVRLDISGLLEKNATNLIAVKVNSAKLALPMLHAPSDHNIGWFMGRVKLDLTGKSYIDEILVYTEEMNGPAIQRHRITIENQDIEPLEGRILVKYYQWFPKETPEIAAEEAFPVHIKPTSRIVLDRNIVIEHPRLWTADNPQLYKIVVSLEDKDGSVVDDDVITTGIRTVGQEGGTFRINGRPEMLNGAQIMGYRMPADKLAMWNRCPSDEWVAKELLMIKKMNGNLLRIHVHAESNKPDGINDPRYAEMADQLGIMCIWSTSAWIRNGGWWNVDFEGYPKYIKQVYNHPSIVMWEVTNHPHAAKPYEIYESNSFYYTTYQTIFPLDQSRLISPTSFNLLTRFGNDSGTKDTDGNRIYAVPEYTAPMVTRGNQDSYTGYGKTWDILRKIPSTYHRDFLNSTERAYFNFEHEESTSQPNWSLMQGKPWYKIPSYEWDYDKGSIGRRLEYDEWLESMAWQAFSAWESMKKQRICDYDGFSWCCLHGGPNMGTYRKPLIDCLGHAKLAYYVNGMIFQKVVAGSDDVDVVYGPDDLIRPVIMNLGEEKKTDLEIRITDINHQLVSEKRFDTILLPAGRTVTRLPAFKPSLEQEGYYIIEYSISPMTNHE
ncbi:MAG: glycosyl hydrolase family 2 [Bacteroidales bacterium]|nr:MAG: glycosyl hydrolase family 2 [Bacteroidales bacterium]